MDWIAMGDPHRTFWDGDRAIETKLNQGGPITFWREPVFPRQEKTFRAQVNVGGTWHDWELPNPTFGQPFPEWKVEALPITRTFGDIGYTAQGWKRGNLGWYLNYELRHKGKPIKWPVVSASSTIYSDLTGNRSHSLLSASNPAWQVRQEITASLRRTVSTRRKSTAIMDCKRSVGTGFDVAWIDRFPRNSQKGRFACDNSP